MLFNRVIESRFAEVGLGKRAPHLDLYHVRDVIGDDDRLDHLVAFGRQTVQEVRLAVGIHDLPMRIGRFWRDEVVRERECALAVYRRMGDEAFVSFCALERATFVTVLGNAARRSDC